MDAYFLHVSSRLQKIREGEPEPGGWLEELKTWPFWRAVLAEGVATMFFVFIGTMAAVSMVESTDLDAKFIRVAFSFGIMITVCIQMVGHVSGGHINPAVSIAMAVVREISPVRAVLYVVFQCVGGLIGSLLLKGVTPDTLHSNLGLNSVHPSIGSGQGFVCELIFTFILVLSIFGCTDSNRAFFGSPALGIGLTVAVLHFAGIPFSGASMNPARTFASAAVSNNFDDHWVYWVGPILGGVLAAVSYKYVFNPYRRILTFPEAADELMGSHDMIAIPRSYFSANSVPTITDTKIDIPNQGYIEKTLEQSKF